MDSGLLILTTSEIKAFVELDEGDEPILFLLGKPLFVATLFLVNLSLNFIIQTFGLVLVSTSKYIDVV